MTATLLTLSVLFAVVGILAAAASTDPRRWWVHWCLVGWLSWMALPQRSTEETQQISVRRPYYDAMLDVMARVESIEKERMNVASK